MAERGAHLTAASAHEDRPSIFEVVAQDSLMSALRPALQHAVKVLSDSNPGRWGWLWRGFDEAFAVAELLLQHHFLSRRGGSFSENFYGLRRVAAGVGPSPVALPAGLRWRSLGLLVGAPYLGAKLGRLVGRLREEQDYAIRPPSSPRARLCRAALAAYPFAALAWQAWLLAQQVGYLLGRARQHSPLLRMAGVRLARITPQDGGTAGHSGSLSHWLSTGLSVGVFFLQFLEWWHSPENQDSLRGLTALPPPPPPLHLDLDRGPDPPPAALPALRTLCPLCRKVRANEAALSTSGFVFCYPCAHAYLKAHQRCPLTGYPSHTRHLVKLYAKEEH
ncbi:peroxisome assembly protein 12 [Anolis carolinensis]|uniref:peroxisome assembly protein 12 n=1 Tax=Anolis carolinensis TaxID=28377 RepID=UPI002F2B5555